MSAIRLDKNQVCCGYRIDAHEGRITSVSTLFYASNDPPMITMHKLGADDRSFLTPTEARLLGSALIAAAESAEAKAP